MNISKTEVVLFKPLKKELDHELKIKLNGKKLCPTPSVKYLSVKIDSNLNWKEHINSIALKLNRANAVLSKLKIYVNFSILKSIYYSIFESNLNYGNIVWAQQVSSSHRLFLLQKRAIRIINSADKLSHTNPLFHVSNIVKLFDKIAIDNCCFISKCLFKIFPDQFHDWFVFSSSL